MVKDANSGARWMWYPGDFEIRHGLKLNLRRDEMGYEYPAFWRLDDCWHSVKFRRKFELSAPSALTVQAHGIGNFQVDGKRYRLGSSVTLEPGAHSVAIDLARVDGLPCAYVTGCVPSGDGWEVSHNAGEWQACGSSAMYTSPDDDPEQFKFEYKQVEPVAVTRDAAGVLYDFGRETFARLELDGITAPEGLTVCYGESEAEARDVSDCYIRDWTLAGAQSASFPPRAFRYIFVPGNAEFSLRAEWEYLPLEERGKFDCADGELNDIWRVAAYTFHLNSREFFLDGIKRDRWIWSGDAYQSYFVNRCLYMDREITQRTIWALRGKDPIEQHINTILDYSLYWVMSVSDYYDTFGDVAFVRAVWPRVRSMMDYCRGCVNEQGFIVGREQDWVFVDWADMDKVGALSAEQMLYIKALEAAARCAQLCGCAGDEYLRTAQDVRAKLDEYFFDEEKGCYIDSYESGRRNVTRHANIFALLYDIADSRKVESIVRNVLDNEAVPPITTPYFKFFELWAECKLGRVRQALDSVRAYWGGMLKLGATTIWEEFDPRQDFPRHYAMYGNKYGKSLCHAWGAGPIYLLSRYVLGLEPTKPGFARFSVTPNAAGLEGFHGTLPLPDGTLEVEYCSGRIAVTASRAGGTLNWNGCSVPLEPGVRVEL